MCVRMYVCVCMRVIAYACVCVCRRRGDTLIKNWCRTTARKNGPHPRTNVSPPFLESHPHYSGIHAYGAYSYGVHTMSRLSNCPGLCWKSVLQKNVSFVKETWSCSCDCFRLINHWHTHTYIHTISLSRTLSLSLSFTHARSLSSMYVGISTNTNTYMHVYIHVYMHTCTYAYTFIIQELRGGGAQQSVSGRCTQQASC